MSNDDTFLEWVDNTAVPPKRARDKAAQEGYVFSTN